MELGQQITPLESLRQSYLSAVLAGDQPKAWAHIERALSSRHSAEQIYLQIFAPAQIRIGELWHRKQLSIAEEHRASEITLSCMERLKARTPQIVRTGYKAIISAVEGDIHTIGARTVSDFLHFEGWEVHFLGAYMPTAELIEFTGKIKPELVGLSINFRENLEAARKAIAALKELEPRPRILIGGALTKEKEDGRLLETLGADRVMKDANEVVEAARELVGVGDPAITLDSYLKELGSRIHAMRKARAMSQQALADSADLDRTYISAVEHGKQNITLGAVVKLSNALKIPLKHLLVGSA
jgi:methanogenic corrinoid protein MtbC1/DNA-binding XRE family transcriptional regulator